MLPRICMSLVGMAALASCTAPASLPDRPDNPASSVAPETPQPRLSSTLDPSIAAAELAPSQPNAAGASDRDPTTNMGDMKGMKMPGMDGGDGEPVHPGPATQPAHDMNKMPGMQMRGMQEMNMPQSEPATTQAAADYTCKMHPQVHQDHPGNCPICGMKLVKKDPDVQKGAGQ